MTPNRAGTSASGLGPGFMSVKFRVASGFNFTQNSYAIVFNTSNASPASAVTPVAQASSNNYAGYSFAIIVGGQNGAITAQAYYYYRPSGTSQTPVLYPINATPQQLIFTNNSNGLGTEFTVVFSTNIANFSLTTAPTPSASPSTSPTSSPGTSSGSSVPVTQYWTYNFFTVSGSVAQGATAGSLTILDSLGLGGAGDSSYQSLVLNIDTTFDQPFQAIAGGDKTGNSDAITGGEIANNPLTTPSPSPSASASVSPSTSPT